MTVYTFFHSLQVHMGYTAKLTIHQVAKQASKTFKRFNQSENVSDNTDIKLEINNNDMGEDYLDEDKTVMNPCQISGEESVPSR